jgi:type 1 glutamine amidotransferase
MKRALIFQGGWQGHQPAEVAAILAGVLREHDFEVEVSDTLDALCDEAQLKQLDLIVPLWTMGSIAKEQLLPLLAAVQSGVGIAGCHGGMADSFRNETEYQYMVGGQWVAHPGNDGVTYEVEIVDRPDSFLKGMSNFIVKSEKYYMHIDPAIRVLAITRFDELEMPVTWTKRYGKGRVFYCSLGHQANIVAMPETLEMMRRGMLWAAEKED